DDSARSARLGTRVARRRCTYATTERARSASARGVAARRCVVLRRAVDVHIAVVARAPRRGARARGRGPRDERHDRVDATGRALAAFRLAARSQPTRSHALVAGELHAVHEPLRRATTPEPAAASEVEASRQSRAGARQLAGPLVARAYGACARPAD